MKKSIYISFTLLLTVLTLSGCDLELQKNYDYETSISDPHVNMTAWEFLQEHPEQFSEFTEAITFAGLEDYYKQTEQLYTYLALNNDAMTKYRETVFPGKTSIKECDQKIVRDMILYHIIDGEYSSYGQLPTEPIFVLTMLKGEEGLMTMCVQKHPFQQVVGKIVINDTNSNGNSPLRRSKTSNIMPTNGVIHIFEDYCYYRK